MSNKPKIRILVVDDHILIRMGLKTISEIEPDIKIVAQVEDGEAAIEAFRQHRPDVVIMDLRLPGMDGVQTIQALRKEFGAVRVLVLSSHRTDADTAHAE